MLTRSRIIAGASGLAGEPANEPLPGGVPEWLRYETAADIETELLRDLNLSTENRTLSSYPVHLTANKREFTVSRPDLENPSFISLHYTDNPSTIPVPIDITNLSLISGVAADGRRAVAFYDDNPQRAMLSWSPSGNERLTVWYDRSPETDPNPDQATFTLSGAYLPLLKLMLAAQMLELMNKPIGDMLKSRITRGIEQWKRFVRNGKQQGIIQKTPWRPGRYQGGSLAPFWPSGTNFD